MNNFTETQVLQEIWLPLMNDGKFKDKDRIVVRVNPSIYINLIGMCRWCDSTYSIGRYSIDFIADPGVSEWAYIERDNMSEFEKVYISK